MFHSFTLSNDEQLKERLRNRFKLKSTFYFDQDKGFPFIDYNRSGRTLNHLQSDFSDFLLEDDDVFQVELDMAELKKTLPDRVLNVPTRINGTIDL